MRQTSLVLYTRIDPTDATTNETRRLLLDALRGAPGALRVGSLAKRLGIDYKTAAHHARTLAEAGLLVVWREGRARWCRLPRGDERFCPNAAVGRACRCSSCAP